MRELIGNRTRRDPMTSPLQSPGRRRTPSQPRDRRHGEALVGHRARTRRRLFLLFQSQIGNDRFASGRQPADFLGNDRLFGGGGLLHSLLQARDFRLAMAAAFQLFSSFNGTHACPSSLGSRPTRNQRPAHVGTSGCWKGLARLWPIVNAGSWQTPLSDVGPSARFTSFAKGLR